MSEPTTTPTDPAQAVPTDPKAQTQGDPADPADLGDAGKKALDAERTARKAAEKRATDFEAQINKINQANESAVEKAQREATEAKDTATKATADALRFRIAAKHGIAEEDADLFLTGTDAETLERQAARLVERTPTTTAGPRPDLSQGGKGTPAGSTPERDFANFLSGQMGR